jgi:hypothetical protein
VAVEPPELLVLKVLDGETGIGPRRHATLDDADLTDTRGCFIDLRTCKTRGTRVDLETAAQMIRDLGLVCADLERISG